MLSLLLASYAAVGAVKFSFLAAVPYILQGLSALGGIFGKDNRYVDPEKLRKLYGAQAVTRDAMQYYNQILASPYGRQLMDSAANSGQEAQTQIAANAAASGLDASTGGESGASTFTTGVAPQIQSGLENQGRAAIFQNAFGAATNDNAALRDIAARGSRPDMWSRIGTAAAQAAAQYPGLTPQKKKLAGQGELQPYDPNAVA